MTIPQRSGTEAITNGFHSKSESQSHPTSSTTTTRRRGGQGSKAEVEGDSSSATPGGGNSTSATTKRFLPLLPPHLHPHTGLLPDNWEDYEPDPTIPGKSGYFEYRRSPREKSRFRAVLFFSTQNHKKFTFLPGLLMKIMPIALKGIPHLSYLMNLLNLIE